jgi:ubiquinone/menaquinone biosynthesis C-methylase UbiE
MLEQARSRGVEVAQAGGEKLPFEAESFDLVTSFACLHHMIDPEVVQAALGEMVRVLRPGATVLVWDHNPRNPYWRFLMARLPQDRGDERLVPASEVLTGLKRGGLAQPKLRRMTFMPEFTPAWAVPTVGRLERLLERIPGLRSFAAHNVVIGRRAR